MKSITICLIVFSCFILYTNCVKSTSKTKSLELSSSDPFRALGIPEFKLDLNDKPKRVRPKLDSIEDLPRFIQSGAINTGTGMKLLTKFLTEDDDRLKEAGGVYDETGNDGLDQDEDLYPQGSEMRNRQRARSAAMLWVKSYDKVGKYEAYGCTPDKEKIEKWLSYVVLLMTPTGEHKLIKVCIEEGDGLIAFGGDPNKYTCKDKVHLADTFREKGNAYFAKKGFAGLRIPGSKDEPAKENKSGFLPKKNEEKRENKAEEKKEIKTESKSDDVDVDDVKKQIAELNNKLQKLEMKKLESKPEMRFSENKSKQSDGNNNSDDQQVANDIADMIDKKASASTEP